MICRWRGVAVGGALLLTAVGWCAGSGAGGARAQIPDIPAPPQSTTVPTTPAPPPEDTPAVPEPSKPPAPPSTVPGGAPGAPPTPVTTGPQPATTTTSVPSGTGGAPGPSQPISSSRQAQLSLDLSEIDALRRQARGKGPRPAEPDFGFDSDLPFGATAEAVGRSEEEPVELGADAEEWARVRSLSSFAAGLVVLVLVGIVMWMLRQARRPSLSPTPEL